MTADLDEMHHGDAARAARAVAEWDAAAPRGPSTATVTTHRAESARGSSSDRGRARRARARGVRQQLQASSSDDNTTNRRGARGNGGKLTGDLTIVALARRSRTWRSHLPGRDRRRDGRQARHRPAGGRRRSPRPCSSSTRTTRRHGTRSSPAPARAGHRRRHHGEDGVVDRRSRRSPTSPGSPSSRSTLEDVAAATYLSGIARSRATRRASRRRPRSSRSRCSTPRS